MERRRMEFENEEWFYGGRQLRCWDRERAGKGLSVWEGEVGR